MPDDVTIGELARRMSSLERRMDDGFQNVNRSLAALQFVHIDRYEADQRSLVRQVEAIDARHVELQATTKRLWWVIVAQLVGLIGEAVFFLAIARGS